VEENAIDALEHGAVVILDEIAHVGFAGDRMGDLRSQPHGIALAIVVLADLGSRRRGRWEIIAQVVEVRLCIGGAREDAVTGKKRVGDLSGQTELFG
jgi:hypothetical protein